MTKPPTLQAQAALDYLKGVKHLISTVAYSKGNPRAQSRRRKYNTALCGARTMNKPESPNTVIEVVYFGEWSDTRLPTNCPKCQAVFGGYNQDYLRKPK